MTQVALIGKPKSELDTPALLVDLEVVERNIDHMSQVILQQAGVSWRPHTKAMKTPALAHKLLRAGAHGITCAKLGEAEVMANGGIDDILIANEVVGKRKIERLVNLQRQSDVAVLVDNNDNVEELNQAARAHDVRIRVLVEVNVGMDRAGVEPGEPVLDLAKRVVACQGLRFAGLQTWESHTIRIVDQEEKRETILSCLKLLTDTAELCRDAGLEVGIVSCGGTGTFMVSSFAPGITEIEAGGGIYGDLQYRETFHVDSLECAMFVRSTVSSRPSPTRIVCDAGKKTMSGDATPPRAMGITGVESLGLSAEHGIMSLSAPSDQPRVGEQIEFMAGYSDTTVVLHDELFGIRDGKVEAVWPLWGRGRLQ